MTDNINPSHYKDGPFECIELSSLLSFDWGNVIKYCYRWRDKNGVEDLITASPCSAIPAPCLPRCLTKARTRNE